MKQGGLKKNLKLNQKIYYAYSTKHFQAVTHPSTNLAQCHRCRTSRWSIPLRGIFHGLGCVQCTRNCTVYTVPGLLELS